MSRHFISIAALSAFIAVAAGAFGAHGLSGVLAADRLAVFETAVRYQMYHALALLLVGWLAAQTTNRVLQVAGWLFIVGTILFSGSLYALTLSGVRWLGAITPFGGLAFLAGWLALAWGCWRR
ncbi:MAG: DUF423 domain-containing protein [Chloroflexota bacterium]|nr:DUF423 domain-containing protein [Chloroflexota bacterium]